MDFAHSQLTAMCPNAFSWRWRNRMPPEHESRLSLRAAQTIRDFAFQHAGLTGFMEDFDDAIERHAHRGELLYLVVACGISVSGERLAHWLDEGRSAPFKLGLVDLRLFDTGTDKVLVVPRTLVKTREISRHDVMVDKRDGPATRDAIARIVEG